MMILVLSVCPVCLNEPGFGDAVLDRCIINIFKNAVVVVNREGASGSEKKTSQLALSSNGKNIKGSTMVDYYRTMVRLFLESTL